MIFAKNIARNYEKTILGTSDAWFDDSFVPQAQRLSVNLSQIDEFLDC